MKLELAYQALTDAAKRQAVKDISALLVSQGQRVSQDYVRQICGGLRKHPCSAEVQKTISGYFRGQIGIEVAPEDCTGVKQVEPDAQG